MNRTKHFYLHILIIFVFFQSLPLVSPGQVISQPIQPGQMNRQEIERLLRAFQAGQLKPDMVQQLQERGKLGNLSAEEIEAGKEVLEEEKEEVQVQEAISTPGIGLDLVDYVNRGLMGIEELEKRALGSYESVTGKNYFTDEKVYDALKNNIIPEYERFVELLRDIKPKTIEVRELHAIYVRNCADISNGFKAKMSGLEKKDAQLIRAADMQIKDGLEANVRWKEELEKFRKKYGIEELAEKEAPIQPDEEFFKKSFGPGRPSLEIFGQKLFSKAPSTFAPIEAMPVSNEYIIGPGDEIKILMWGRLDETYSLVVDNEGIINIPKIGPLTVAGLTFAELKELIKLKTEAITGVNVNVSMGRLRTIQVFVLGEVKSPGVYTLSSLATVGNALLSSGGPTSLGSLREVELKRQGKTITVIDIYDFLLKGDTTSDTRLMPGDVIFVPQAGPMVSVSGNVKRPAIYELKDDRTLEATLNLAGGLTPWGYKKRIQIERATKNQEQIVLDISYEELGGKKLLPLKDGDLIRVFPIIPDSMNAVYLFGNVLRPGQYAYKPGLRITDVLPSIESLEKETYFDYALIKRYHFEDMAAELIPFDLGRALLSGDVSQNIRLMPKDELYIFNKWMFEDRKYAVVEGQVRKPGRYFIDAKGMRLKDLLFKAGSFNRDAYLETGHLFRKDQDTRDRAILTFNIQKAINGDPQHNLLIQDQDHVFIHSLYNYKEEYTVSIRGMVQKPGEYPYAANMTIKDLIELAGNIKDAAYTKEAELVRFDIVDGKKVETSVLNFDVLQALKNAPADNLELQPLDMIHIKQIPAWWDKKKTVTVSGEVYFPGAYQVRKNERLSNIIKRAGGYTEQAYLRGAMFTREAVRQKQQERLNEMLKRLEIEIASLRSKEAQTALSGEDLAAQNQFISAQKALVEKLREAKASGRVVISLKPLSELVGTSSDLVLEGGDMLFIPLRPNTVNVLGSVYNPTSLVFEDRNPRLSYYLNKTGGPTENAEIDQMYIIRADGTVVSKGGDTWFGISWGEEENRWALGSHIENMTLYPGDTVLVPQKMVQPSYMRDIKDITEIVYQIAVVAGITVTQVF